jgi:uncharacterized protein YukE
MSSTEMGINETKMDELASTLLAYLTNVKEALDNIDLNMDDLKSSLGGDIGESVFAKYEEIKEQYSLINANLEGYRNDLIQVKINYINQDANIQINEVETNNVVVETGVK